MSVGTKLSKMTKISKLETGDFFEVITAEGLETVGFLISKRPNCEYGYNEIWTEKPMLMGHNILYSVGKGGNSYDGGGDKIMLALPCDAKIKKRMYSVSEYKAAIAALPKRIKERIIKLASMPSMLVEKSNNLCSVLEELKKEVYSF